MSNHPPATLARSVLFALAVLPAACSTQTGTPAPTATRAAPTAVPAAAVAATPSAAAGTASPVAARGVRFTLTPDASEARYRAREQFVNAIAFSDAVGKTSAVEGQVVLDAGRNVVPAESRITVDLASLQSDQQLRDNYLRRNTLLAEQYPTAELRPTEARGLPTQLPTSGAVTFQLIGDLTVRGVTRPSSWDVQAQLDGPTATGKAVTQVTLADFELPKPSVQRVLSIEDTIALEIDFRGTLE